MNHNTLLKLYEYADGMKTGFTKAAGRCLVSSATRDGIKLICVTLHAPDDWNDHIRMLEYGFSRVSIKRRRRPAPLPAIFPAGGGTEALVTAVNQASVAFPAVDGKTVEYTVEFVCPEFVLAPVKRGAGGRRGALLLRRAASSFPCRWPQCRTCRRAPL